ncbi:MAG: hypothetical protein K1X64_08830 [Myxococcaceae bacterium]|nr:hypothetical protein [Myxococcaceae bacterium]
MHLKLLSCVFTVVAASPAVAATEPDWFSSLYTGDGMELRADERVFALFAVLNATGFDAGPVTRTEPVPKVNYHPVRALVRTRVIGGDPDVRKAADAFLDAHPTALKKYLGYVVSAGPAPFSAGSKLKDVAELKGLETVLARAYTGWKLDEVLAQVQGDYRKALKAYLASVDAPLAKARATLKVPDSAPPSVMVMNLLDAQDTVRGVQGDNEVVLVVGPAEKPNVEGVVREYARVFIDPLVSKKVAGWAGGAALLKEAQVAGAPDQTPAEYASSLLGTALALKAINATDAQYDAAQARGYFGVKEIAKMFDDGKPVEGWVLDALARADARRPARKQ